MRKIFSNFQILCFMACTLSANANEVVSVNIDAAKRGAKIGDLHYGIFYEEINNAGDGGIYAELIRNRSFEDGNGLEYWSAVNSADLKVIHTDLMNDAHNSALEVKLNGANAGIKNPGYWGIDCKKGDTYKFSFWVKSDDKYASAATASLVGNGKTGGSATVDFEADGKWKKVTGEFTATEDIPDSEFTLTFAKAGKIDLDMVSLFPPTYKNRENGCRVDLAEMLEALKPAFVRFPGGCYIEGDGTVEDNRRFEWKKTVGPIEQRPGHYNYNWGYPSTDGMGFHEFLQLTEDLGAEPLFVANIGIGHGWYTDYTQIDDYIQEALDAIEYCNGDESTYWGKQRALNGHPEPFNLRLIEIGNENYNYDDDRSDHYAERYKAFYDAIKAQYPEVTLIGNVEAWGTDNPSWRNAYPCEIIDEHYYRSPAWFEMQYHKYDSYDRTRPKVYVGEYAVTDGYGTNGNLAAALGEAVYMLGMEKNSDIVIMNSYAPIFYNEERGGGWLPDMIRFSSGQSYGTPSYYVQQLMPNNIGKQNVIFTEDGNVSALGDKIGVSTWSTTAKFDNITVTDNNGEIVFSEDFSNDLSAWNVPSSSWKISGGQLQQGNGSIQGQIMAENQSLPGSYTLELDATKTGGVEGFLIIFNYKDDNNYCWWNIGGWNNTQHGIQLCKNGSKTDYDIKSGSVQNGKTYKIKIEVNGGNVKCYLDGELIHDLSLPVDQRIYVASTIDDDQNLMFVKIVNTQANPVDVNLNLANASIGGVDVIQLTSSSASAENSAQNPNNVVPTSGQMKSVDANKAVYTADPFSLGILKINLSDINYSPADGKPASEEQIETAKEELSSISKKLNYLHSSTSLPVTTASGSTIEWAVKSVDPAINVASTRFSSMLEVLNPNSGDNLKPVGEITATVTFPDGAVAELDYPVTLAPADNMYGYLYIFMNPAKEITNYALATKESLGKKFNVLLEGDEIFNTEELASIEHGTRDAYMDRGQRDNEYFMTTTDMSNIRSGIWNNYGMDLLRSTDMVHWESSVFDFRKGKSIFSDPEATIEDGYKTDEEYAKINRVWAPQFIWDENAFDGKGAYLVYYSLLSSNPGDNHDRIFYSYADKDFKTLTQPRVFYDPGYSVIDADIVFNPYDNLYHMMIKKEGASAEETGIYEYTSPALLGEPWEFVLHVKTEGNAAVEGATQIRRIDEDAYNLYYMRYDSQYQYKVVDLDHLGLNPAASVALAGNGNFQHGSMIYLTKLEYDMLSNWSEMMIQLKKAKGLMASDRTNAFDEAVALAEKVLAENHTVEDLAAAIPEALEALYKAMGDYIASNPDEFNDITSMLVNPDFNENNGNGWSGTSFTATSNGVAEHWNKNYDTYQILSQMPAGTYRLEVQGFYRNGYQDPSKAAHKDGTEQMLAMLYINDAKEPFMCLYDEDYSSYPDNVSQANSAFNTDHKYRDNSVTYVLEEMGDLKIGIMKNVAVDGDWNCFDNFKLYFKPAPAGVESVKEDLLGTTEIYDLKGIKVNNPSQGIFVIKNGNKVNKKVIK